MWCVGRARLRQLHLAAAAQKPGEGLARFLLVRVFTLLANLTLQKLLVGFSEGWEAVKAHGVSWPFREEKGESR